MKGTSNCKHCSKEILWSRSERELEERGQPKFCSRSCMAKATQKDKTFSWDKLSDEQKIERLRKSFEKKVVKKEGCWDWTSSVQSTYGAIRFNGEYIGAHRASWLIHKGEIPEGQCICHTCDNRLCTNPEHLFLGSYKDNSQDRSNKGRGIRGERCPRSKLNPEKVKEIREKLEMGIKTSRICQDYGISKSMVFFIKTGKFWKWVN